MSGIRGAYVMGVRTVRKAADKAGLLAKLENSESPRMRHLRTLFSIFDAGDLARMDLAWWSYPAMRRVEAFLAERPGARVFEFGAGASTAWLARRAGQVDSVEHDTRWVEYVRELLADTPGVKLHAVPATPATAETVIRSGRVGHTDLDFGDYVATIDQVGGPFDVIVVDGRARNDAFRRSLDHLADGGVVVYDNIRRKRYWDVVSALPGLRIELLKGATPTLPYPTTTGLIWRD
ncbi:MAG: class I SAM-dependent methyltransferase [Actinophytocola sp.]|uniref:class I SAM-dependent methyltransferase n=1 Tax=Actinophytocola sp. TaxID=1872138 RepID=UPI00132B7A81|nr:class I SAM-dependent methyltransferase [Actinophytocola sp.]MPZ81356.1 class I SAM-dependent methyltransferase [Actinophytocola sp.]